MAYEYKYEAQPVYYNGFKTNSKLEARWMVFFDAFGIKYQYEPDVFKLENGILYRPDFLLTNVNWKYGNNVYCEIKGTDDFSKIKIEDQVKILSFAEEHPILVFGNLPYSAQDVFYREAVEGQNEKDIFTLYWDFSIWRNTFFEKHGNVVYMVDRTRRSEPYYECDYALAKARLANFNIL